MKCLCRDSVAMGPCYVVNRHCIRCDTEQGCGEEFSGHHGETFHAHRNDIKQVQRRFWFESSSTAVYCLARRSSWKCLPVCISDSAPIPTQQMRAGTRRRRTYMLNPQ